MKITWLGHSAFRIETGKVKILIDPFFTGNPAFDETTRKDAAAGLTHILLTHGHGDHVGDTIALAEETGATVLANADLAAWLGSKAVKKLEMGNTVAPSTSTASRPPSSTRCIPPPRSPRTAFPIRSAMPTGWCCISRTRRRFTTWATPTSSGTWR